MREPKRPIGEGVCLQEQARLVLPAASSAEERASLSIAIQTTLPPPHHHRDTPERRYVRAVLARYLWLPETPSTTSRHDRRLAKTLYERGIPLLVVEGALLLAAARRALRDPALAALPRVRALHYYLPVIEELLAEPQPPELDYLLALLRKLRPLAESKSPRRHRQERAEEKACCAPPVSPTRPPRRSRAARRR
jgi:hypothetical protein